MKYEKLNRTFLVSCKNKGMLQQDIAKTIGCCRQLIVRRAKSFGVKFGRRCDRAIYPVKYDYFDNWSHRMAYVLGFIMADGCVNVYGKNHNKYRLQIQVNMKDLQVLEFIKNEISPNRPIYKNIRRKNKSGSVSLVGCLTVSIKKDTFKRLCMLGIVPRKSGKELIPKEIPEEFLWSYILGLFDGDGSIYHRKQGGFDFYICSYSKKVIVQLKRIIPEGKVSCIRKIWRISIRDKLGIRNIRNKLYENAVFSLERKYKIMYIV